MKRIYITPELEKTVITSQDVITDSIATVDNNTGDNLYSIKDAFSLNV